MFGVRSRRVQEGEQAHHLPLAIVPLHLRDGQGADSHLAEFHDLRLDLLLHPPLGILQQSQDDVRRALGGLEQLARLPVAEGALRAFESRVEGDEL